MHPTLQSLLLSETGMRSPRQLPNLAAWYDPYDLGSMVVDASNRVQLVSDKSGNSAVNELCLNGVTGNLSSFTALTAAGTGDFSVSQKVRFTSLAALSRIFGSASTGFLFTVNTDGSLVSAKRGTGDNTPTAAAQVVIFTEYVIGYTRIGTTGTYYVNGVAVGTTTDAQNYAVGISAVGATDVSANTTAANIKWARVYNAGLTAPQMLADAAGTIQSNNIFAVDFSFFAKLATSAAAITGQTVTINTTGRHGARISGARDLVNMTAAEQPVYLPWSGANYGYLNAVSGNYFSTPDSVALSITGVWDVDQHQSIIAAPASTQCLWSKRTSTGSQRSVNLGVNTNGTLGFTWSTTGAADAGTLTSSAAIAFPFSGFIRCAFNPSSGGNARANFYTSTDGVTWSALGVEQTAAASTIFDSTAPFEIGSFNGGTAQNLIATVRRTRVYSGLRDAGGTLVADFDPARYVSGTTFTGTTGETWTLNGGAKIVTRTQLYHDGVDDNMKSSPFALPQPAMIYIVDDMVSWTSGEYIFDGNAQNSMAFLQNPTTPSVRVFAGSNAADNAGQPLATPALVAIAFDNAASSIRVARQAATTGTAGSSSGNGITVGCSGGISGYANFTESEMFICHGNHSTQMKDRVALYAQRKHRLPR
jgi:hypothetical protein